jgi:hypothetical protein
MQCSTLRGVADGSFVGNLTVAGSGVFSTFRGTADGSFVNNLNIGNSAAIAGSLRVGGAGSIVTSLTVGGSIKSATTIPVMRLNIPPGTSMVQSPLSAVKNYILVTAKALSWGDTTISHYYLYVDLTGTIPAGSYLRIIKSGNTNSTTGIEIDGQEQ